jgi:DNA-directed RNA polymerase specialized sigma24 family protein
MAPIRFSIASALPFSPGHAELECNRTSTPTGMSDDEVIAGLQYGGHRAEAALTALARGETARHMLRFFMHQGLPQEDALETLQETLIRIDRYASKYRGEGSARSWFWQIARNCLANHWRGKSRSIERDPCEEAAESERLITIRAMGTQTVENGVRITRLQYAGEPLKSGASERTTWVDSVDEHQWATIELTVAAPDCQPAGQSVAECVASGFEIFASVEPDRAHALGMQMDGHSISEIADFIGRTVAATKEYLCQCRKKIKPFIEKCRDLQEA